MFTVKGIRKEDLREVLAEMGETVNPNLKMADLKKAIEEHELYLKDPDFWTEFLLATISERKDKLKMEHELELARMRQDRQSENNSNNQTKGNREMNTSIEKLVKAVRVLTMPVPELPENWSLFFESLERSFNTKSVPEEMKAEILINIMEEKVTNLLIYLKGDEIKDYNAVKDIILREYEPTAQACLENFRKAKRYAGETHVQFATRLTTLWSYYCKRRKANDLETINSLIVADRMFESLDNETAAHISIRQGDKWFRPLDLGKECDIYYSSRGKSFSDIRIKHRNTYEFHNKEYPANAQHRENIRKCHFSNVRNQACFICGNTSHLARNCTRNFKNRDRGKIWEGNKRNENTVLDRQITDRKITARVRGDLLAVEDIKNNKFNLTDLRMVKIRYRNKVMDAIVDSGTQITVFNEKILEEDYDRPKGRIRLQPAFGDFRDADLREVNISLVEDGKRLISPTIKALVASCKDLNVDVLLDQQTYDALIEQAKVYRVEDPAYVNMVDMDQHEESVSEEEYRKDNSKASQEENKLEGDLSKTDVTTDVNEETRNEVANFKQEQLNCTTLQEVWDLARKRKGGFIVKEGLLYHEEKVSGYQVKQLVLPLSRRKDVLEIAHESVFGAHLAARKTVERIKFSFFWPSMSKEIKDYCSTCHKCQTRKVIRSSDKIPITPITRPKLPFQVVNIDIIGPIEPKSSRGHQYVICLIDQHSRWPEAIPLSALTAKATCTALLEIFCRTGIPDTIVMDNATNFTSCLTKEFLQRMGASPRFCTPGHPESNGLVERWNQTFKNMLHHVIRENRRDWDRHIPFLLWAYREVPNSTTGVPPFLLMYGRIPKGPLSILKSTWSGEVPLPYGLNKSNIAYLQELKERLEIATERAKLLSTKNLQNYANYYNLRRKYKEFMEGDLVLALIPDSTNKLYSRWIGPVEVVRRKAPDSYYVKMPEGNLRLLHVNKLRKYEIRVQTVGIVFEDDEEFGELYETPVPEEFENREKLRDLDFSYLEDHQQADLRSLMGRYKQLFSGNIRRTKMGKHSIKIKGEKEDIKPKSYRVPEALKSKVDKQIQELLKLDLIEPAQSEIAHPIVCVNKKDGTLRLCVDYRSLNNVTVPDAYPMQNVNELIILVGKKKFITTLDMLKGYWAIQMDKDSRELTAFKTHRGHYQWKVMPFGLRNAAATYQRTITKAIEDFSSFSCAYIDDLAVFSDNWEEHIKHLRLIFQRLEDFNFSINLSKCNFAKSQVKYLGHLIGSGEHGPDPERVQSIKMVQPPKTKKQLRSVLGLFNYYRSYIPNFATIALPLTQLTKKKIPNEIPWNKDTAMAFQRLKDSLCDLSQLYIPEIGKPFYLYTDASQYAIGSCLSQADAENNLHPIAFGSQKLSETQQKWATIEREAFAIIWALKRFETLLFGSKIFLMTDHNPLVFLSNSIPQSPRLQRWALAIQRHDISITYMKGCQLGNADALSRL